MIEKHDPIENSKDYKKIENELEEKIHSIIGTNEDGKMGFCHIYWAHKKEILKKDYNIDWKSPAELNPWIIYD